MREGEKKKKTAMRDCKRREKEYLYDLTRLEGRQSPVALSKDKTQWTWFYGPA